MEGKLGGGSGHLCAEELVYSVETCQELGSRDRVETADSTLITVHIGKAEDASKAPL
jgi:hypothetical protein